MKKQTKIHLAVSILIFMILIGVYSVFYFFLQKEIENTQKTESSIVLLEKKNKEVVTQKKLIDETKQRSTVLRDYFVYEERAPEFLEKIEEIDTRIGTESAITSISTKTQSKEKTHSELVVVLESNGTYQEVFHFLQNIENLPYEIKIQSTSFARTAELSVLTPLPQWRLSLTFSVVSFIPANQTL